MSFFQGRLEPGRLVIQAKSDASLTSFSSLWWGWRTLDEQGNTVQEGALQLAGLVPGQEVVVNLAPDPSQFELFPVRNHTPFPVSQFKVGHSPGLWQIRGKMVGSGSSVVWVRFKSKRDPTSPIVSQKVEQYGQFCFELLVPEPWDDVDVVKERSNDTLVISDLACVDVATGQVWAVCEQASRPLHDSLEVRGSSLAFLKESSNWSYFTCIPVPF